jgi:membrane associated rhomboid family serine protease
MTESVNPQNFGLNHSLGNLPQKTEHGLDNTFAPYFRSTSYWELVTRVYVISIRVLNKIVPKVELRPRALDASGTKRVKRVLLKRNLKRFYQKLKKKLCSGKDWIKNIPERKKQLKIFIWRSRATLLLVSVLVFVYIFQMAIAESIRSGAAYGVIESQIRPHTTVLFFLSPLLHSSHQHLVKNLASLTLSGGITERRIDSLPLIFLVYLAGILSNALPSMLKYGGIGIGISGAFYGLWTYIGISYATEWWDDVEARDYKQMFIHAILWLLGLWYAVTGVLQYFGLLPVTAGTATGAHLTGVIFGAILFGSRPLISQTWQILFRKE